MRFTVLSKTFLLIFSCLFLGTAYAQKLLPRAKADITLTFSDKWGGTNGSGVAFNSSRRLYYAVIAGNEAYPIATFNEEGGLINQQEAGVDTRGLWWNPSSDRLELNAYNDGGWYSLGLQRNGVPSLSRNNFVTKMHQPASQSAGTYNTKKKRVVFYDNGVIYTYKRDGSLKDELELSGNDFYTFHSDHINSYSIGYIGKKKHQYVILDVKLKAALIFDKKGRLVSMVELPSNAITHYNFRFSYANNRIWLFDPPKSTWTGYLIYDSK